MGIPDILSSIDAEIARLTQARALLAAGGSAVTKAPAKARRAVNLQPDSPKVPKRKKKRNLTPEGRARIAEAAKRRWAAQKKAAAK